MIGDDKLGESMLIVPTSELLEWEVVGRRLENE
jgi:hypothetical protein